MKKRFFSLYILLLIFSSLPAQLKHEFSMYGGGGLSALRYDLSHGEAKERPGGQAGFGYTYFILPNFGITSGLEFAFYKTRLTLDSFSDSYLSQDKDGREFEFHTTVNNLEEKQNAMFLQVPLMLQFHTKGKFGFYMAAGCRIAIPTKTRYRLSGATTITSTGYYADEETTYTDDADRGFGTFAVEGGKKDMKFKVSTMVSLEAGMRRDFGEGVALYVGAFVDYGLNNIHKADKGDRVVKYDPATPGKFEVGSVLNSGYVKEGEGSFFTEKIKTIAIGVKVKMAFGLLAL